MFTIGQISLGKLWVKFKKKKKTEKSKKIKIKPPIDMAQKKIKNNEHPIELLVLAHNRKYE